MAYADQQMSGNRVTAIIIVAVIHIVVGYALVTGLAYRAVQNVVEKVTTIDIKEEVKKEEPPPPPPKKLDVPPPPQKIVTPPTKIQIPAPPAAPIIDTTPVPLPPAPPPVIIPPPSAPPPPRFTPKGASPKGQSSWARRIQDNYPPRALREEREGRVGVRVTVGADGRVTACTVTSSSGSNDLDSAACDGMERYARFNPATDGDGKPTSGSFSTNIVYRLN
jgi:protein TonB